MQKYLTAFRCIPCGMERPHHVTYLGNVLASVTCAVCGETIRPRVEILVADYVRDFELRLIRKPGRMLTQARHHPLSFVFGYLPRGLMCKPREVLEEWETLVRLNQAAGQADAEQQVESAASR